MSEEWVDVTAECEVDPHSSDLRHAGKSIIASDGYVHHGYRLRKIEIEVDALGLNEHHVAFIVERKA